MVKLVALYKRPSDPESFDRHYREVHAPLAARMPGLRRMEVARITGSPGGESPFYLMAEMYFDSAEALQAALASAEGKAAGKDLMTFARGIFSLHIAEVEES